MSGDWDELEEFAAPTMFQSLKVKPRVRKDKNKGDKRHCNMCEKYKPLSEFGVIKRSFGINSFKPTYQGHCNECNKAYLKKRRTK